MASYSMSSKKIGGRATSSSSDELELEPGSFKAFARENFMGHTQCLFTRKDIRHQVYRATPDADKKVAIAIFRTMMRFMGDQTDYRAHLKSTYQPNLGPVMTRIYKRLGVSPAQLDFWRERSESDGENNNSLPSTISGPAMLTPRQSKTGGTLRRMKATLTQRLFTKEQQQSNTIFQSLPLEESLMSPLEQLHFIIGCGLIKTSLRDEIYCQVCKQLIDNPFKSSVSRGWLLLGLICSSFPPSEQVIKPIIHFLGKGPPFYSVNCKKGLQRTLQNGVRHQPPSFIEMEASLQKTLLEIPVTLMDGSCHSMTVDSATTAKEFCAHLAEVIGLNEQFGFSVYISMSDKVASLGNGHDQLFDAISQCEQMNQMAGNPEGPAPWRLFFRKELFSPWESAVSDPVATDLIFAQVVRGVMLGEYICEQDNQLSMLAAQQYYIEYGKDISEDGLNALLPSYIPPDRIIDDDSLPKWKKQIVKSHEKLFANGPAKTVERVKQEVVHFAKTKWPMSFSRYYDIRKLEGPEWPSEDLCLAVNWTGVYVLNDGDTVFEMAYPEITSITNGGSPTGHVVMFFLISGSAFKFNCKDGDDVRHLVLYMYKGLRRRSTHAIATETYEAQRPGELSFYDGDLILLTNLVTDPDPENHVEVSAVNERTGDIGDVKLARIYRLPTLARPSNDLLKVFQTNRNLAKVTTTM